jgi:hypothetical protein
MPPTQDTTMTGTQKETGCSDSPKDFLHATEDMQEWMLVSMEHQHTLFTDWINTPCMDPIDGTLKFAHGFWHYSQ